MEGYHPDDFMEGLKVILDAGNYGYWKFRMRSNIENFSSKLSALVQESHTLGIIYKDAKLVKKLMRCLPSKFTLSKAG
ncbi:unnamed protein product [Microthlaspi erraticum]|uniref:Uncharacterized protein n=1 Tax=Microthlaspi erraticum TaxID=1685480 RepID=A0A6D2JV25_9BRAS|nr:unnamed protein product [Microthlaspi erraticum]